MKKGEVLRIPYIKETETLIKTQFPRVWQGLVEGKSFSSSYLRGLVFNYPNTLLLNIQERLHLALQRGEKLRTKPVLSDYVGEMGYLIERLVDRETAGLIFDSIKNGKKLKVHLVEDIDEEKIGIDNLKRPKSRGRRFFIDDKEEEGLHIYLEARRQSINNENNPPTDFLEIMSFLGFYEMTRFLTRLSFEQQDKLPKVDKARKKLLALINKFVPKDKQWQLKDLKNWAQQKDGIVLETQPENKEGVLPLQSLSETIKKDQMALYRVAMKIGLKMEELGLEEPESIVLGNAFTFPLLLALPLVTDDDLSFFRSNNQFNSKGKPLDLLPPSIKREKLDPKTKGMLEKFMYLQELNRYQGEDEQILEIKNRIFKYFYKSGVIERLFEDKETALGDPVDYYDFSRLTDDYIVALADSQLPDDFKKLIFDLYTSQKKFLNFSYPLGDNTYGLIEALTDLIPSIENVVFFGKVGATLQWDGENHVGAKVGRVVIPEFVASTIDFNPQAFGEKLKELGINLPIVYQADQIELILQTEGVLLQTLMDIKKAQEAIISNPNIPYNEKIKLLIDMESYYLNLICRVKNIKSSVIYYTSDNSRIPPLSPERGETILQPLEQRGSFAVMVAGWGALLGV